MWADRHRGPQGLMGVGRVILGSAMRRAGPGRRGWLVGRRMLNSMWASTSRALVKISSAVAVQMNGLTLALQCVM